VHASEIIRARRLPPSLIVECQSAECTKCFPLSDGFPMPIYLVGEHQARMGFFCSPECYLRLVPPARCWRA
jgi:hypothetical protein